jgi:hypothetical protein
MRVLANQFFEGGEAMIRLIAVAFALALASSAQAHPTA